MPELPEVETMRRGLLPTVGGTISAVDCPPCQRRPILIAPPLAEWGERAVGQKISAVERAGKRVVIRLTSGDALVIEPRMTGLVLLAQPPTQEHLRLRIKLRGCKVRQVLYWDRRGLGIVRLVTAAEFHDRYGADKLGPDALTISADALRERLKAGRRPIKVALLDQRTVAGVGNLYASEILHLAQIHPATPCLKLRERDWDALHAALVTILEQAIQFEGSTLADGTYRNALNLAGGYQNHHRVYDRAGEACQTCRKDRIVRAVQAQRSTFFCPRCQATSRTKRSAAKKGCTAVARGV